jgi:hypothetical protein
MYRLWSALSLAMTARSGQILPERAKLNNFFCHLELHPEFENIMSHTYFLTKLSL